MVESHRLFSGSIGRAGVGKFAIGLVLVSLAIVALFSAYSRASHANLEQFLVASHDLEPGTQLTSDDLKVASLGLDAGNRSVAYTRAQSVIGKTATVAISKGALLTADILGETNSAGTLISVPLESARALGGRVSSGDRVDLLATYGSGQGAYTIEIARGAVVVRSTRSEGISSSTVVLTLDIGNLDPTPIAHAARLATLTLSTSQDDPPAVPRVYHPAQSSDDG